MVGNRSWGVLYVLLVPTQFNNGALMSYNLATQVVNAFYLLAGSFAGTFCKFMRIACGHF